MAAERERAARTPCHRTFPGAEGSRGPLLATDGSGTRTHRPDPHPFQPHQDEMNRPPDHVLSDQSRACKSGHVQWYPAAYDSPPRCARRFCLSSPCHSGPSGCGRGPVDAAEWYISLPLERGKRVGHRPARHLAGAADCHPRRATCQEPAFLRPIRRTRPVRPITRHLDPRPQRPRATRAARGQARSAGAASSTISGCGTSTGYAWNGSAIRPRPNRRFPQPISSTPLPEKQRADVRLADASLGPNARRDLDQHLVTGERHPPLVRCARGSQPCPLLITSAAQSCHTVSMQDNT
jgi:hypothetical protein